MMTTVREHRDWLETLHEIKTDFVRSYGQTPRRSRTRVVIYNDFCKALANFYGSKPTDIDIIEEVDMELIDYGKSPYR